MPTGQSSASLIAGTVEPEPSADPPRDHCAWQLRVQSRACARMGSPLYAHLLDRAAVDCQQGGVVWRVLQPHVAPARGEALALRLMAAVHRLVLTGDAGMLAEHYPSVGGTAGLGGAWPAFREALVARSAQVAEFVAMPCQTNEVGRSAGLVTGFLEVAARTGLPMRILEVGASAGLNLRWDHFRYSGGGAAWGDPDSPVDLRGMWRVPPPTTGLEVEVVERAGCDRNPVDPRTADGLLTLSASLWADQPSRLQRLRGAAQLAERIPARVARASLDEWLPARLAELPEGVATVVYQSVVEEYLPGRVRARFHETMRAAGRQATARRPLAWVRLEPISQLRHHGIDLTLWPGGRRIVLARCGAHGSDVEWLAQR